MKKIVIFLMAGTLLVSCGNSRRSDNNSRTRDSQSEYADYDNTSESPSRSNSKAEPNENGIKRDLVGKIIVEPTKQLYRSQFNIRSAENVLNVEITNKENNGNEILYSANLLLTDEVNKYKADVNITYSNSGKGWQIQYIESKSLDIVPTGKFDNCISVGIETSWLAEHLFLYNNCDVTLIVEGRIFAWSSNGQKREWQYFADEVPANGKKDFYYETDADYKITRIERP